MIDEEALVNFAWNKSSLFQVFFEMGEQTQGGLVVVHTNFCEFEDVIVVLVTCHEVLWYLHVDFFSKCGLCKCIGVVHLNCLPVQDERENQNEY